MSEPLDLSEYETAAGAAKRLHKYLTEELDAGDACTLYRLNSDLHRLTVTAGFALVRDGTVALTPGGNGVQRGTTHLWDDTTAPTPGRQPGVWPT